MNKDLERLLSMRAALAHGRELDLEEYVSLKSKLESQLDDINNLHHAGWSGSKPILEEIDILRQQVKSLKRQLQNECDNTEKWRISNKELQEENNRLIASRTAEVNEITKLKQQVKELQEDNRELKYTIDEKDYTNSKLKQKLEKIEEWQKTRFESYTDREEALKSILESKE